MQLVVSTVGSTLYKAASRLFHGLRQHIVAGGGGNTRAALAHLRAVYDASPDMIFLHASDGCILDMNDNALRCYGYRSADIGTLSIGALSGKGCGEVRAREMLARALSGERLDFDWVGRRRDGTEFPVEVRLRRIENPSDDFGAAIVAIVRDISERHQAEEALRQSVGLFESAFEHAAIGMALVAPGGRWLKVNQALCRITGYSVAELTRLDFQTITYPDDLDADLNYVDQLLAGEIETYQMEKRYIRKGGESVWVLLSVSLARGKQGEPLYFISQIQDISKQKNAEKQLQDQRDFSEAVVNIIGSVVVVLDRQGIIVEFNEAAEKLTGYRKDEVIGKPIWDLLLPPEQLEAVKGVFSRLTGGDFPSRYENYWVTRGGERRLLAWSNTALLDARGAVSHVIATGIDVTEQRRAEQGRLHALERLRTLKNLDRAILSARSTQDIADVALANIRELIRAFRAGICRFNFDNGTAKIIGVSGYTAAGIGIGDELPISDIFVGDLPSLRAGQYQRTDDLSTLPRAHGLRKQLVDAGVRSLIHVPLLVQGELFGCINLMATEVAAYDSEDIEIVSEVATSIALAFQQAGLNEEIKAYAGELEQRVSERTLALARANEDLQGEITIRAGAEAVLRDREQRFRRYYELGLVGMAMTSLDKRWIDFNDQLCEMLGYSHQALKRLSWAQVTHPDDLAEDLAQFNRVLAGEIEGYSLDKRFLRKDGSVMYASISARCVRTAAGEIDYFVKFVQDITERKLAEEATLRSNQELAAANRDLESFSYSVSHDLRTPLRAIDGFSMVLLEDYGDRLDERGRTYFARIRRAAQTMGHLIDDLLKLSRVGRLPLAREPVDMTAMCHTLLLEHHEQDPERTVVWRIDAGLAPVADPVLLRAVLGNIIGNAWKFTAENPEARIEVGQVGRDHGTYYYVRDNGVGFDMQYADKIFQPFQRLHDTEHFAGTGIGLATVARIIHRHGGRVWAEAEPSVGAAIYFSLPADPGGNPDAVDAGNPHGSDRTNGH